MARTRPRTRPTGGRRPALHRGRGAGPAISRLVRSRSDRILAGVAGGLAEHLGIDAVVVRLGFVVLSFAGGAGIAAYLILWLTSVEPAAARPQASEAAEGPGRLPEAGAAQRTLAFALVIGGALLVMRGVGAWLGDAVVWPVALGAAGSAVIWTRADARSRARWSRAARILPRRSLSAGPASTLRVLLGGLLIVGGMGVFLAVNHAFSFPALRAVVFAVGVTVAGAALILGPGAWRLVRQLTAERRERIRSEERAAVAAHLHDSVLQSLAMIQRASSSEEMATLARAQERELRAWLYAGGPPPGGTLRAAVVDAASRVEALHHVEVEVVQVGDGPLDDRAQALVQAAGEAMTNAARHSEARRISTYVEVEPQAVTAFIRDRGKGFEPRRVGQDRRGIADSIRGRMERAGGTAEVTSEPGEGTEVVLRVPRSPA